MKDFYDQWTTALLPELSDSVMPGLRSSAQLLKLVSTVLQGGDEKLMLCCH